MSKQTTEKITIHLPNSLYHVLRNQAYRQNLSLPDFIRQKIELKPTLSSGEESSKTSLADLPLKEILAHTTPVSFNPDDRLDFFNG